MTGNVTLTTLMSSIAMNTANAPAATDHQRSCRTSMAAAAGLLGAVMLLAALTSHGVYRGPRIRIDGHRVEC
jgi:hypothetical protein